MYLLTISSPDIDNVAKSLYNITSTDVWLCNSVMLLTLAVVLPTPHDYSSTFQGRSARFSASRRVLKGARKALYSLKTASENSDANQLL